MRPTDDPTAALAPDQRRPPAWRPRSTAELLSDQLAALDAWHRAHVLLDEQPEPSGLSREARLDAARREEVRQREQQALLARAEAELRDGSGCLGHDQPRVVLAHRNGWFRDKVADRLRQHGLEVLASVEDGASAVGAVVLDQPDLLLVEDLMPHLSGAQVVQRSRQYAPLTLVAGQAPSPAAMDALVAVGARAVFSRRIPPVDVADALVACLADGQQVRLV